MSREGEVREICERCGAQVRTWQRAAVTVDMLIQVDRRLVLVYRKNDPVAWALPGGYCNYGERLEDAARREALEETGLELNGLEQFHTYSEPDRDPRQHSVSTVFLARGRGTPRAGDDAGEVGLLDPFTEVPHPLAFDHSRIVRDYVEFLKTGRRPG
ncbi:MAG TPA: NUDIX hydrolase [Candidatus Saccharimonadales bacterium]|nr:NUDIX hydrolase [Candidatus Saccharimonadales bacterium]